MLRNAEGDIANAMNLAIQTNLEQKNAKLVTDGEDDAAGYLFEMLVAARRLAVVRRHRFLAYLIGMAVEEARLLAQGRSAIGQ